MLRVQVGCQCCRQAIHRSGQHDTIAWPRVQAACRPRPRTIDCGTQRARRSGPPSPPTRHSRQRCVRSSPASRQGSGGGDITGREVTHGDRSEQTASAPAGIVCSFYVVSSPIASGWNATVRPRIRAATSFRRDRSITSSACNSAIRSYSRASATNSWGSTVRFLRSARRRRPVRRNSPDHGPYSQILPHRRLADADAPGALEQNAQIARRIPAARRSTLPPPTL